MFMVWWSAGEGEGHACVPKQATQRAVVEQHKTTNEVS